MTTLRCLLGIVGGLSAGYAIASLFPFTGLNDRDFGVAVAISAACVLGIYLIRAIQSDRDDQRRLNQERVWLRREQDPDWIFNAPYWELPEEARHDDR